MKKTDSRVVRGCISATLGAMCWGVSGTFSQFIFMNWDVSSAWLSCIRMLFSGILLTLVALPKYSRQFREIWKYPRDLGRVVIYGLCGLLLCNYAYSAGIYHSNAATTTVLQTLNVVFIMVIACLQTRRKPRRNEFFSVLLALIGTYLLVTGGDPRQMILSPQGLFWGLTTAVGATIYTTVGRPLLQRWNQGVILGIAMIFAGIVINCITRSWTIQVSLPMVGWLAVGVTVVIGSLAFFLFLQGIRDAGPVRASILSVGEPLVAALLGVVWLGDSFSLMQLVGFAAILAIVFLLAKDE